MHREQHTDRQERFINLLKEGGLKKTPGRLKVLEVFFGTKHALTHHEIEEALPKDFDRVTLYRTLNIFDTKGIIHRVVGDDGVSRYAFCSDKCDEHAHHDNHLHFFCHNCKKVFCLDDHLVPKLNLPKKYQVEEVDVLVKGTCEECIN